MTGSLPGAEVRAKWARPIAFALTSVLLVLAAIELIWGVYGPPNWRAALGHDLRLYTDQVQTLLAGGPWYHDRQLHGPYPIEWGDILYPPVAALFFAPWIVLPLALWFAIPIGLTSYLIAEWRPRPATWVPMALCILWPSTLLKVISGNPSLWVMLLVALGLRYRWPSALILLKPSFLPLAFMGIRSRGWWVAAGALGVLSLPFLGLTLQYPQVLLDSRSSEGIGYSLADLPMVLIPAIAWLGRAQVQSHSSSLDPATQSVNPEASIFSRRI
jgi:hypothetical protein